MQVLFLLATLMGMVFGSPFPYEVDQETAASGKRNSFIHHYNQYLSRLKLFVISEPHHGRVQIKVFRGPTEHDGHDHFAPWGYWVKQPGDDHH